MGIQLPYETVEHVVNSLFLNGKNKYIRTKLRRLFVHLGASAQESSKLANQLLTQCDLDPTLSAVRLTLDEIKALCFGFQHMKERHSKLLQSQSMLENVHQCEAVALNNNNTDECSSSDLN